MTGRAREEGGREGCEARCQEGGGAQGSSKEGGRQEGLNGELPLQFFCVFDPPVWFSVFCVLRVVQ